MTRDQFCNPLFTAAENANVTDAAGEVGRLGNCAAVPRNIAGWLFLLSMTSIILLLEGNYIYRVSSACTILRLEKCILIIRSE